jgi:hypothetical protein
MALRNFKKFDHYMTPASAWEAVAPYIPRDKTLWLPFYGDGGAGEIMESLGFNVIHEKKDFFEHNHGEIIVDNPPYSIKKEVFTQLKSLGKPFMMLVPLDTLSAVYFMELFGLDEIQLLMPKRKIKFIKMNEECSAPVPLQKGSPFNCAWVCWRMNFPQQLIRLGADPCYSDEKVPELPLPCYSDEKVAGQSDLNSKTVKELKQICRERKYGKYSRLTKAKLIELIQQEQAPSLIDYESKTIPELKKLCKERKCVKYSRLRKSELIQLLRLSD